jgi:apoptosis-inducing factor 3
MENIIAMDFGNGIPVDRLADGEMLQGRVDGEDVVLARHGGEFFGVGADCTHYGAPLANGLIVGSELRCPRHHVCFGLRTGEALRAPAWLLPT